MRFLHSVGCSITAYWTFQAYPLSANIYKTPGAPLYQVFPIFYLGRFSFSRSFENSYSCNDSVSSLLKIKQRETRIAKYVLSTVYLIMLSSKYPENNRTFLSFPSSPPPPLTFHLAINYSKMNVASRYSKNTSWYHNHLLH